MGSQKRFLARNGLDNNSQTIVNVGGPVNATDAVNKEYSDNAGNLSTGVVPGARMPAFTGDATSAQGTTALTLADTGVAAGTYKSVTVDAKGRVVNGSNPTTLSGYGITDAIALSQKGAANGVATLDSAGLIPANQLPSYVDDVMEFATLGAFPATGEASKIYVAADTSYTYRWSGSGYIWINGGAGSADSAVKLSVARTIATTGDASWSVSFDGSSNVSAALTLASTGIVAGTYNSSATTITPITFDAKGRAISAGSAVTITPAWSNVTDKPTTLAGYGIVDAQALDADLTAIAALSGTSGFLKKTAANTWSLDTSVYLTGNQNITISGDASGSGATNISLVLSNTGVVAGTYNSATTIHPYTIDAKGRITAVGGAITIAPLWSSIASKPTTLDGYGITDALKADGVIPTPVADHTSAVYTSSSVTANQVIDSVPTATYRSVKYIVQAVSGTKYQVIEIMLIHNGTVVYMSEYAFLCTEASPIATFDADISNGSLRLLATPANAETIFKIVKTLIDV